jgi:hypothetical protein
MVVKQPEPGASVVVTGSASRALIRQVGPTAWAVLQDVSLDARREDDLWVAQTSVRRVAGHLGLTPGTVARSLARLCAAGLLHREDRRDAGSGRFVASVYVVVPTRVISPCVDLPYTVEPDTASGGAHPSASPPSSVPSSSSPSIPSVFPSPIASILPLDLPSSTPQRSSDTCHPCGEASRRRARSGSEAAEC